MITPDDAKDEDEALEDGSGDEDVWGELTHRGMMSLVMSNLEGKGLWRFGLRRVGEKKYDGFIDESLGRRWLW